MAAGEPIWNKEFSGTLIRIPLGLYFLFAGRMKLEYIDGFIETVRSFGILPDQMAVVYGVMVPWIEAAVGIMLVVGFWTTPAAILAALMLVSYIIAMGLFPMHPDIFNKDIILLCCSLALLATGGGVLSIDGFRRSG